MAKKNPFGGKKANPFGKKGASDTEGDSKKKPCKK
jgi:hypothetical protein